MVAIIGNKGSGKSALSDTIGLLSNSDIYDYFSFLSKDKFTKTAKGNNRAKHFEAALKWRDGTVRKLNLIDKPDSNSVQKAKYLPQQYLEKICTEIGDAESTSTFDSELEAVIFSRLDESKRQGFSKLKDLLKSSTLSTKASIEDKQNRISSNNEKTVQLEEFMSEEHKSKIKNLLKEKKSELKSHDENKLLPLEKPDVNEERNKELSELNTEIENIKNEIEELEKHIENTQKSKAFQENRLSKLTTLNKSLDNANYEINESIKKIDVLCEEFNFSVDVLVDFTVNKEPVESLISKTKTKIQECKKLLDKSIEESLVSQLKVKNDKLSELQKQLDKPNKDYQAYLQKLKIWENRKNEIIGDSSVTETIKYYEYQLEIISNTKDKIDEIIGDRQKHIAELHKELSNRVDSYKVYYEPVQSFIDNHELSKKHFNLSFKASIVIKDFEDKFFECIAQNKTGSFYGTDQSKKRITDIINEFDLSNVNGLYAFLDKIYDNLVKNYSVDPPKENEIDYQLRNDFTRKDLYDALYKLEYLDVNYTLTWDGKEMEELSPGERGALLLMFFLLIDNRNIPLIIDQPEENLDNQTVYEILVDAIKEAKERRQIIIVTHNPNLAVVCDADQIIYAEIDKQNRNKVTYESGAIENPSINKHIVDVLEGTMQAFNNRDSKYRIIS